MNRRTPGWALALVTVAMVVVGFLAVDDYSVTWDEALGDLFFGERYLSFFTSLDSRYLDFELDVYPEGRSPDLSMSPFRNRPWEYYPVANVLAAATSALLSRWAGWLDPFAGYHAVNLWLGALFVWLLVRLTEGEVGRFAAVFAVLLLFSSPRVVVHWLANSKDFPEMILFASTLLVFHAAWRRGSRAGVLIAGALSGLALGAKANALFLPAILLSYLLIAPWPPAWRERRRRAWATLAGASVIGVGVLFASWPYLWADPMGRIGLQLDYVRGQIDQVRAESLLSPLAAIVGTTPIPFLLLTATGLCLLVARVPTREPLTVLLLGWIAVVFGRLYLPGAVNFDGVRHFLELFPALALTGALTAQWLRVQVVRRLPADSSDGVRGAGSSPVAILSGVVVVVFAIGPGLWASVRSHPHQIAYWNALVGGVSGAHDKGIPQAGDYWGLSYRQGLRWVNESLPAGSILAVPVVEHAVNLVGQTWLRPDIGLAHVSIPNRPEIPPQVVEQVRQLGRERPVFVMFVPRSDWTNQLMIECLERLEPVHTVELDGVPLLLIYRYPDDALGLSIPVAATTP